MSQLRIKYNWSNLDRYSIYQYLMLLKPKLVGQELPIEKFQRTVSVHLKKQIPLKFKRTKDKKVDADYVWVGGCYYSDLDQYRERSIEITMVYSLKKDTVKINIRRFKNFCMLIADTILHEVIHMRQYRQRKFKILDDYESTASRTKIREAQSYLGCPDEIDAYSFNIACELHDKFKGNTELILKYLDEDQKGKRRKYDCWRTYLKAFQHDHNHPILQKVKQKVVKYLSKAKMGKPFKNNEWINR